MKNKERLIWLAVFIVIILTTKCSTAGAHLWCDARVHRMGWSMYAHKLILRKDFRYSPYAFGDGHNGLVSDERRGVPGWPSVEQVIYHPIIAKKSYQPRKGLEKNDPRKVIFEYLKKKKLMTYFRTEKSLTVNNETVCVDFVFKHKPIVIRWDRRKKYYENHIATWQAKGNKIYLITNKEKEKIEGELKRILATCFF